MGIKSIVLDSGFFQWEAVKEEKERLWRESGTSGVNELAPTFGAARWISNFTAATVKLQVSALDKHNNYKHGETLFFSLEVTSNRIWRRLTCIFRHPQQLVQEARSRRRSGQRERVCDMSPPSRWRPNYSHFRQILGADRERYARSQG